MRILVFTGVSAALLVASLASAQDGVNYEPVDADFLVTWERTDRPVAEGATERTWIWGPGGHTGAIEEGYAEAPGGVRKVQYFDKSRMELTQGEFQADDPWSVTQGLLARELITGYLQLGHELFEGHTPADIPVAGDPDDESGPRYSTFSDLIVAESTVKSGPVVTTINREGDTDVDQTLEEFGVSYEFFVAETGRNIASPFWDVINAEGLVFHDGQIVTERVFPERFYVIGLPITDPYWSAASVAGEVQPVLVQCFERRCLTYTPGNESGWQVEAGNVGQHYYEWRYNQIDRKAPISPPGESEPEDPVTPLDPSDPLVPPIGTIEIPDHRVPVGNEAPIQVIVTDDRDVPVVDVPVTFEPVHNGDAVAIDPPTAITGNDGIAESVIIGQDPGSVVIDVSVEVDGELEEIGREVVVVTEDEPAPPEIIVHPVEDPLPVGDSTVVDVSLEDENGEPISDTEVIIEVIAGDDVIEIPVDVIETDDTGSAEIEVIGVTPGTGVIEIVAEVDDTPIVDATPIVVGDVFSATADVSNTTPATRSNVTVSGTLTRNGVPVTGAQMTATWYFRTVTSACTGQTDGAGRASCTRQIGAATPGYTVLVRLAFEFEGETHTAWTSFTPQ